ncbi:TPA: transposase [Providencia alcalifaciens]|nr:transposase [Providencia alcalifaciens]
MHFAKKTKLVRQNVNYLVRYLKRPPVAASKLRHYSGETVLHHYYDHRTVQHKTQYLSQKEILIRYIIHIPSRHLKMVWYYAFLANQRSLYLFQGEAKWCLTILNGYILR